MSCRDRLEPRICCQVVLMAENPAGYENSPRSDAVAEGSRFNRASIQWLYILTKYTFFVSHKYSCKVWEFICGGESATISCIEQTERTLEQLAFHAHISEKKKQKIKSHYRV